MLQLIIVLLAIYRRSDFINQYIDLTIGESILLALPIALWFYIAYVTVHWDFHRPFAQTHEHYRTVSIKLQFEFNRVTRLRIIILLLDIIGIVAYILAGVVLLRFWQLEAYLQTILEPHYPEISDF